MRYENMSPAEQITSILSRMYERELTTSTGGNLSIRDNDGVIWITPSATDKGNMLPSDIVRITPDGINHGKYKPSIENKFHRGIYEVRSDIKAIIHAHSVGLITFSCMMNFPYTNLISGSGLIREIKNARVPGDMPGSDGLTESVTNKFKEGYHTVLIDNHGVIIGADSLHHAFLILEELELIASIHLNAMTLQRNNPDITITRGHSRLKENTFVFHQGDMSELRYFLSRGYKKKLFTSRTGRISVRASGNSFYINSRDCDRREPVPDDIFLITPKDSCEHEENLHRHIYESNPEIGSIITAVPENAMTVGVLNVEYNSRCDLESCLVLGTVKKFTQNEYINNMRTVVEEVQNSHVGIVQNEFVITCGIALFDAFDKMEIMENGVKYLLNLKRIDAMPFQIYFYNDLSPSIN